MSLNRYGKTKFPVTMISLNYPLVCRINRFVDGLHFFHQSCSQNAAPILSNNGSSTEPLDTIISADNGVKLKQSDSKSVKFLFSPRSSPSLSQHPITAQ